MFKLFVCLLYSHKEIQRSEARPWQDRMKTYTTDMVDYGVWDGKKDMIVSNYKKKRNMKKILIAIAVLVTSCHKVNNSSPEILQYKNIEWIAPWSAHSHLLITDSTVIMHTDSVKAGDIPANDTLKYKTVIVTDGMVEILKVTDGDFNPQVMGDTLKLLYASPKGTLSLKYIRK
jgi:hypothetical protein